MRWVVQSNLGNDKVHEDIKKACERQGIPCDFIIRVPFSKELPDVPRDDATLFYGSTRFVNLVFESGFWKPAAFFDDEKFSVVAWGPAFGEHWLNHGAKITTLNELQYEPYDPDRLFFVRPVRDLKEFNGGVWSFSQLKLWNSGLLKADLGEEQLSTVPIVVADPWGISREWRLFVADGCVVTASQYRTCRGLDTSPDVPSEVITFGERMAQIFQPHRMFLLDICESADNLYVLELGCVNSAGFYAADVDKVIEAASKIAEELYGIEMPIL